MKILGICTLHRRRIGAWVGESDGEDGNALVACDEKD
jgi:hypothetical protein